MKSKNILQPSRGRVTSSASARWCWSCTTARTRCWSSPSCWSTPGASRRQRSCSAASRWSGPSPGATASLSLYYLFFLPIFGLNVDNALNHMVHITRSAVSRCYLFPTRVLYSTLHAAEEYIDMFPAYYIFNTLLISLQFLNVVWTVQILRVRSLEGY